MFERVKKEPQGHSSSHMRRNSDDGNDERVKRVEQLETRNKYLLEKIRRARDLLGEE